MIKKIFVFFLSFFLLFFTNFSWAKNDKPILFYGQGCPHCQKVEKFLKENDLDDNIEKKEVYHNPKNAQEFNEICEEKGLGLEKRGVPFLYADGECFIGDDQILSYFENKKKKNGINASETKKNFSEKLNIFILMGAALTDAINPCAFAVLLILMSTVLANGNRRRALFSGLSFSFSIFLSYFLMGLGAYSIISNFETSQIFVKIIGVFAILIGLFNLKDYFWYGKLFVMEVPMSWRPKLKKIISSVLSPLGAFLIGFLVSLFLLPCTSGPYIVIIGMLGQKVLFWRAVFLLLLYNLIFVLPMLLITIGVYFGLNVEKAEKMRLKRMKTLHLIAGIIMTIMGIVLLYE